MRQSTQREGGKIKKNLGNDNFVTRLSINHNKGKLFEWVVKIRHSKYTAQCLEFLLRKRDEYSRTHLPGRKIQGGINSCMKQISQENKQTATN